MTLAQTCLKQWWSNSFRFVFAAVSLGCLFLVASCSPKAEGPKYGAVALAPAMPELRFAVHPLYNPAKLYETYQPMIDYLNTQITGVRLVLEASRDYGAFEEKYKARKPEFLLPNPWQTLQALKKGYHVILTAGEAKDFKGIFIVRKDSTIKRPIDLRGKAVSYPAPTALAACIMPQYFLHQHGINVNRDIENRYVGSQESSIMNVYLKKTAVGVTWPPPWRAFQREHRVEAAELKVLWETEPLINNSVMARDDVPEAVRAQVQRLLVGLDKSPEGKKILSGMETARFTVSQDKDYEVVKRYVDRFEKQVRKVADQ